MGPEPPGLTRFFLHEGIPYAAPDNLPNKIQGVP